jgi:hypothetical protein
VLFRPTADGSAVVIPAGILTAAASAGTPLDIYIEGMGHINYGHGMDNDVKGLLQGSIALNGTLVTNSVFTVYPMKMRYQDISSLGYAPVSSPLNGPSFYSTSFTISSAPTDTYLTVCGWTKGNMYVNGNHAGRFWETAGPQHAFYIPASFLVQGLNEVVIFEQHGANNQLSIAFTTMPDFTSGGNCSSATLARYGVRGAESTHPVHLRVERGDDAHFRPLRELARREKEAKMAALMSPASSPLRSSACVAPHLGQNLTIQDCATAGTAATQWTFLPSGATSSVIGKLQLTAVPSLCVGVNGTNPDTNTPNVALVACTQGRDPTQDWFYLAPPQSGGQVLHISSGTLIDIPNSSTDAGTRLELYSYNGGYANQKFNLANGQLTTVMNGFCVSAC